VREPIASMPGQFQFSADTAMETVRRWAGLGLPAVLLFGVPALLLGMASPYAAKLYVSQFHQMGGGLGQVYGVSTVGSILGTLGTAFYLTAWIGTDAILRTNGVVLIGLGAALVAADALRRGTQTAIVKGG
jgi:hypothetical protein